MPLGRTFSSGQRISGNGCFDYFVLYTKEEYTILKVCVLFKLVIMKKMFFRSLAVVAIAAVACYNVYQSNSVMNRLSDLALANVEALAEGESDLSQAVWNREDYTLDNGTPAANCWKGGNSDCILR